MSGNVHINRRRHKYSERELMRLARRKKKAAFIRRIGRDRLINARRAFCLICLLLLLIVWGVFFSQGLKKKSLSGDVVKYEHYVSNDMKHKADLALTVTPSPTPTPLPDVSGIDVTLIESRYEPEADVSGLERINFDRLGNPADIEYLKGLTKNGHVLEIIKGTAFADGVLIVNKTFAIPADYIPVGTYLGDLSDVEYSAYAVNNEAYEAYLKMKEDAEAEGLDIHIASAYRSYHAQSDTYAMYERRDGTAGADTYSSRPGHSEHQTGLCFDLNSVGDEFADTPEGMWVDENCWKYGYCVRFPKGKDEYTGYKYESWHLRYVGTELAKKLYNNGDWISLEEFFGLPSEYPQ